MHRIMMALIAVLVLSVAPLSEVTAQTQGKKIAHLTAAGTDPFIQALAKFMTERAKAFGMEVTTFTSPFDAALQAQQIDDAIARKFDLLAIMAVSEQAVIPALTRAKQAGVPVLLVNAPPRPGTEDLYVSFIGEDHVELGRITGESVLNALKESGRDGGKVALITGSMQEGVAPRRVTGFREALKANPKVQIVAQEDTRWSVPASEKVAGQLYARFAAQGGLDVLYAMADHMAHATIQAAEAAGIPLGVGPGKLTVISSNCNRAGIANIKAGKQYSTGTQSPIRTGVRSAELIADYFSGKQLPKFVYLPVETITRANVEKWEAPCTY